ncbi:hypothetical protein HBI22_186110 [Parastagonospora nodorum]|nr:hypothetical protein HBI28_170670 [Parastagonospora nodorum]KAH5622019.1 hypothetical protein HBI22_186110 [Parastagonospora nodorum]
MDRFCTICGFQPKTYAGLAKHISLELSENVYETLQLNETYTLLSNDSTVIVYDYIEKDKNADLAIADGISDALDMCAKDDLVGRKGPLSTSTQTWEVLFQTHDGRLAGEPATAESVTAKDPNYVDTFGLDFAFSFAAWLQRIKCTLGDVDSLFADARLHDLHMRLPFQLGHDIWIQEDIAKTSGLSGLKNIQQSLLDGATVVPIIISVDKTQLLLILGDVAAWLVYVIIGNLSPGFIPTTKIRDPLLKSQVYYYCMGKLLSPLENAAKSGILLACADGRIRQCYPTICAILADYEEQVLLTSVKKNRYCTRCTVAPDDREDLCRSYLWRTEQFTQLQQERCLNKGHDDFVHLVDCFGWKHYNFNIHVSLATDTLHLLLKGLVMKMLDFMQDMLDDIYPSSRKTWDNSTTPVTQESGSTQLNERFQQKAIIQQLMAVVSLLFVSKAPFALHFIRAVCDLVTLAMNVFKEEFRVYRRTLGEEKNFNYPKWHALTHIIQDIRMYGALDGIYTGANSEAHYITMVKQFYSMTNKKEYILQICLHNSRRTALLAADYATVVKQNRTYSTRVTRPLPFRRLGWSILGIQPHSTKLLLSEVAANIAISDFTYAAAVFDCLDVDPSWVGCMSVQIHPSIKCWRSSGKRHNDPEHCDEEVVRCAPNWQQTGLWRRDYVWVQEFEHGDNRRQSRTVTDNRKHMAYIGAFSEVLLFNNNGQIDNTTGMLSTLQAFKFYDLSTIIRPVHLVPRDLPDSTTHTTMSYYVNNYID